MQQIHYRAQRSEDQRARRVADPLVSRLGIDFLALVLAHQALMVHKKNLSK
jgi:hypothetical protein